jgi:hypothetical protein
VYGSEFAIGVIAGCQSRIELRLASEAQLPDFLSESSTTFREAYQFALANPDELKKYPCYCGCNAMGHESNLDCYISDIAPDGRMTLDKHASQCAICVEITRDVMRLKREGWSSSLIRRYIDSHYSERGPATNTPLPRD